MSDSPSFADVMRRRRRALDLTQAALAERVGCALVTVKRIERGDLRPSRHLAERICAALGISPAERADILLKVRAPRSGVITLANPYKGLHAFQESDAADFFGRAALVARLRDRLDAGRMLTVVGPSGSGKSSAVRAGLITVLRRETVDQPGRWTVAEMMPGASPFAALRAALLAALPAAVHPHLTRLPDDARFLARAVQRGLPADDGQFLMFIDQLEELFTLCADDVERMLFLDAIAHAATTALLPLRIVVTIRADFFDRPLQHRAFGSLLQDTTELVLPLSDDELRAAILGPAARSRAEIEPALTTAIVSDVRERPGALPLLQYTLTELFERRDGARMTLAAYEALGGIAGALARRADTIYAALCPAAQDAARRVFLHLVQPGETSDDTRRRVAVAEMGGDDAADVLAQYGSARLLTFDRDMLRGEPTVEIAHEALFGAWGRLRGWLDARRDDLRAHRRLAAAAAEWEQHGRAPDFLALGQRLALFEALAGGDLLLTAAERAFVAESVARREAQAAVDREREAALRASLAGSEAQRLAAEASRVLQQDGSVELGALLALRSLAQRYTPQGDEALSHALTAALPIRRFVGHTGTICALAFSTGGDILLTGGRDGALLVWDVARGVLRRRLADGVGEIVGVALHPSGTAVLFGGGDTPIRRVDIGTGVYAPWQVMSEGGRSPFVLTGDGAALLVGSSDGSIHVHDATTGALLRRLHAGADPVCSIACATDRPTVVVGHASGTVCVWDSERGLLSHTLTGHRDAVTSVCVTADGSRAVSGCADSTAMLWDLASGTAQRVFGTQGIAAVRVRLAPGGETLAVGTDDGVITISETGSSRVRMRLSGMGVQVYSYTYSPDGRLLAAGGTERVALMWDTCAPSGEENFVGHRGAIRSLALARNGRVLLSGSADGTAQLWDTNTRRPLGVLRHPAGEVMSVGLSADQRYALTGGSDGAIGLWELDSCTLLHTIPTHAETVNAVVFTPDGDAALSCGGNAGRSEAAVCMWDLRTGALRERRIGHTKTVGCIALTVDGMTMLTGSDDWTARLWRVGSAETTLLAGHSGAIWGVAFTTDGRMAATASFDRTLRLWDVASGALIRTFGGHTGPVQSITFSPDDQLLLSGSADGTARLWDVATGREVRRLGVPGGPLGPYGGVRFLSDGRQALTAGADGVVRCWHVHLNAAMDALRRRLLRDLTAEEMIQYGLRDGPPGTAET